MTVFKTFWKVVNRYRFTIILYTVLLIVFGGLNIKTSDTSTQFVASKPKVLVINKDKNTKITENFINYIKDNCEIVDVKDDNEAIDDALFYRDVNYIVYIPKNYTKDLLNQKNPELEIKSTGDYQASLAEMMISRYVKVSNVYVNEVKKDKKLYKNQDAEEKAIISKVNKTISKETEVEITSKLDSNNLTKAAFYYNFLNYSILAGLVYVICLILSSFREENVRKRTIISSMNYRKHNMQLLLSNGILAIALWIIYVILSFILVGDVMLSAQGLVLIANSFVFSLCALSIAFLVGNLISNKNAINGIINVIGLGSSFLCGAFVPVEWLPDTVLKIAHILPSYWYIQSNEKVKTLEVVNLDSLKDIFVNMGVVLCFALLFVVLSNVVSRRKRKLDNKI